MHTILDIWSCARRPARVLLALWLLLIPAALQASEAAAAFPGLAPWSSSFDPTRDPQLDFAAALERAAAQGRPVLVMVGGDWCVWCFLLDRHLNMDAEAAELLYGRFEILRVYYGDDNTNQAFLAAFPDFQLFPHFFVVSPDGRTLASVTADVLIGDAKYQNALIRAFADQWSPAQR